MPRTSGPRASATPGRQNVTGGKPHGDVDTILRQGSPSSIVLTYDGGREPDVSLMTQLDRLVASMTDRGYRFVTVSELLSALVQGGVDHSRLHRQFRLASPARLRECRQPEQPGAIELRHPPITAPHGSAPANGAVDAAACKGGA